MGNEKDNSLALKVYREVQKNEICKNAIRTVRFRKKNQDESRMFSIVSSVCDLYQEDENYTVRYITRKIRAKYGISIIFILQMVVLVTQIIHYIKKLLNKEQKNDNA